MISKSRSDFVTLVPADRTKPHIHYMFGEWESYGKCSADCGWGTKERTRACQQVSLLTMQTLETGLDAQLCINANLALEGKQTSFCKIKDCVACASGDSSLGAFKYEIKSDTAINQEMVALFPYDIIYRLVLLCFINEKFIWTVSDIR